MDKIGKNVCSSCPEARRCAETSASLVFFLIGIIATISVRAVTVLVHINPVYGQAAWYVGVAGFLVYFLYKFKVDRARSKLIDRAGLMAKMSSGGDLSAEDRDTVRTILCALKSKRDSINYFFIFASSALALILAVYLDFVR